MNVQGAVGALLGGKARRGGWRKRLRLFQLRLDLRAHRDEGVAVIEEDQLARRSSVMLYGLTKRAAETILPRIAVTQGVNFTAARLGSVYGPWEYATGVRDTLSPMLQVLECARAGREAVLGPPWRGDYIYSARMSPAGLM